MDIFSKRKRSEIMSKIRSKKTKPEMAVHNFLKGNRVRHKMWPRMPGNPDIFIGDLNLVVYINGCFWHGCERHFRPPKSNKKFWREKIEKNIERQGAAIGRLKKMGYGVVVIWEHDLGDVSEKTGEGFFILRNILKRYKIRTS